MKELLVAVWMVGALITGAAFVVGSSRRKARKLTVDQIPQALLVALVWPLLAIILFLGYFADAWSAKKAADRDKANWMRRR